MIFLLIAVTVIFISYRLFKKVAGTMSIYRINMISWIFYYFLILQCMIGAVEVVTNSVEHYMIDEIQHQSTRIIGFFALCWCFIGLPIGMIVACKCFKIKSMSYLFDSYCRCPIIKGGYYCSTRWVRQMCLTLSVISMLSVVYVFAVIHELPFVKFFSGESAVDLALYRQSANRAFPGNEYVKNILALYMCPIFSYIAYGYYLLDKSRFNKLWWLSTFMISLAIVTFDLSKAPVLIYLLGYLFIYILTGHKIKRNILIGLGLGLVALIIILYIVIMQSDFTDLLQLNSGFIGRMTLSSIAGLFLSFDLWPSHFDFLGLSSISQLISSLFGLEYSENYARLIMSYVNPSGFYGGSAGMINSLFIGEAYAMFGWPGVIFSPIYVGFLIQCVYIFFLKSPKSPFFLGYFTIYSTQSTMMGGFGGYIYNIPLLFNLILFFLVYGIGRILGYFHRKGYYKFDCK